MSVPTPSLFTRLPEASLSELGLSGLWAHSGPRLNDMLVPKAATDIPSTHVSRCESTTQGWGLAAVPSKATVGDFSTKAFKSQGCWACLSSFLRGRGVVSVSTSFSCLLSLVHFHFPVYSFLL